MLFSCSNRRTNILWNMNRNDVVHILCFHNRTWESFSKLDTQVLAQVGLRKDEHSTAVKRTLAFFFCYESLDRQTFYGD